MTKKLVKCQDSWFYVSELVLLHTEKRVVEFLGYSKIDAIFIPILLVRKLTIRETKSLPVWKATDSSRMGAKIDFKIRSF